MESNSEKHIDITMEKVILDHIRNNKIFDDITLTDTNETAKEEKISDEEANIEVSNVEETYETSVKEVNVEVTSVETSVDETSVDETSFDETSVDETNEKQILTNNLIDISVNNIFNEKEFNSISNKRGYNVTFFGSNNQIIKSTTSKLSLQFCKTRKTFYIIFDNKVSVYLRINSKTKTISNFYLTKKSTVFTNHFNTSLAEIKRISVN